MYITVCRFLGLISISFKIRKYKKDFQYSYTIGAFPTIELLKFKPSVVLDLFAHSKLSDTSAFANLWHRPFIFDDRVFVRLGLNDNCFVLGAFEKYHSVLDSAQPHIVLVNPGDSGNLGTVIRTVLAFGYKNLAIISPSADIFDPKTVRASMGALFHINFSFFDCFHDYCCLFPDHSLFPFMTDAPNLLIPSSSRGQGLFSLIFGSETSGLDDSFRYIGSPVKIPQTNEVDSLNLAVSVAIAAFAFSPFIGSY